jgi:hypothetical protein
VLDASGGVCECQENGSTKHRSALCHLFCVKLGDNATTTHGKLQQAFGGDAMSRAQTFHWHKMYSEGRTVVNMSSTADEHQQHGEMTARVRELVRFGQRLSQNDC